MITRPLVIVLTGLLGLLPGEVQAQQANPAKPATETAALEQPRRVSSFRLLHASAAAVAQELNHRIEAKGARAIVEPRKNSVVVLAPAAIQPEVAQLVAELDVVAAPGTTPPAAHGPQVPTPQSTAQTPPISPEKSQTTSGNAPSTARADQVEAVRVVQVPRGQAPALERALDGLAPGEPTRLGDGNGISFAVMRISPTTQRALAQLLGARDRNRQGATAQPGMVPPPSYPQPGVSAPASVPVPAPSPVPPGSPLPGYVPATGDQGAIDVLRLHGVDVEALARTVAAVSAVQGAQGSGNAPIIVVLPSRGPGQPGVEIGAQPSVIRR